jgi:hypothetical protein
MSNKWTDTFKEEVKAYALETSCWSAHKKYNIGTETIRYWIDPNIREKLSIKSKRIWAIKSQDPEFIKQWNEKSKQDRKDRPEYYKALGVVYRNNNRERVRAWTRNHRLNNLEHYNQQMKANYLRYKESGRLAELRQDPVFKLKRWSRMNLLRAFDYSQTTKDAPTVKYLGCSNEEFKKHIESKFQHGMTWLNRGRTYMLGERGWHLDHILPLNLLKEDSSSEMLAKLNHYTNMQPLWEEDNLEKGDSLDWEMAELEIEAEDSNIKLDDIFVDSAVKC